MPILFPCGFCQRRVSVSRKQAGQRVPCPRCHVEITVPSLDAAQAGADFVVAASGEDHPLHNTLAPAEPKEELLSRGGTDVVGPSTETELLRVQLERERLELERERLEFERQKIEGARPPAPNRGGKRTTGARKALSYSDERRIEGHGDGGALRPRARPRRSSNAAPLVVGLIVAGGLLAAAGVFVVSQQPPPPAAAPGETAEVASLRRKAEAGDGEAALALGQIYFLGVTVKHDPILAQAWLERAAELGSAKVAAETVVPLAVLRERMDAARRAIEDQERVEEEQAARARAEEARRRREEALARRREQERVEEEARRHELEALARLGAARAEARRLRGELDSSRARRYREIVDRLAELERTHGKDAELRELVERARGGLDLARESALDRSISHARRLADAHRYSEALDEVDMARTLGLPVSQVVEDEAKRWREQLEAMGQAKIAEVAEQQARARAAERTAAAAAERRRMLEGEGARLASLYYELRRASNLRCTACDATRRTNCADCEGTGQGPCVRCKGKPHRRCANCAGSGQVRVFVPGTRGGVYTESCRDCGGKGAVTCPTCRGSGIGQCKTCQGQRQVGCSSCVELGSIAGAGRIQALYAPGTPQRRMKPDAFANDFYAGRLPGQGPEPFVDDAKIMAVTWDGDDVLVVQAAVCWGRQERNRDAEHHETRWQLVGESLGLAVQR